MTGLIILLNCSHYHSNTSAPLITYYNFNMRIKYLVRNSFFINKCQMKSIWRLQYKITTSSMFSAKNLNIPINNNNNNNLLFSLLFKHLCYVFGFTLN